MRFIPNCQLKVLPLFCHYIRMSSGSSLCSKLAAICVLSLLLVPASWALRDACVENTFLAVAGGTPFSVGGQDVRAVGQVLHDALKAYTASFHHAHQLVSLAVSGATPCEALLSNWTLHFRGRSRDPEVFQQARTWSLLRLIGVTWLQFRPETPPPPYLWISQVILRNEFWFLKTLFPLGKRQPTNILDLGGNCGMATLYMATLFPNSRVVLVEPSIDNFLTARVNTAHIPNVFQEHAAIAPTGYSRIDSVNINGVAMKSEVMQENALIVQSVDSLNHVRSKSVVPSYGIPYLMKKHRMEVSVRSGMLELCHLPAPSHQVPGPVWHRWWTFSRLTSRVLRGICLGQMGTVRSGCLVSRVCPWRSTTKFSQKAGRAPSSNRPCRGMASN
jgi:FkbM family methyltransferase